MPLVKPALATLAIFTFLSSWNNFLWPLVATNDPDKYTLPVALATFATDPTQGRRLQRRPDGRAPSWSCCRCWSSSSPSSGYFTQGIATAGLK